MYSEDSEYVSFGGSQDNAIFEGALDLASRGAGDCDYINGGFLSDTILSDVYQRYQPIQNAVGVLPTRALATFHGWSSIDETKTESLSSIQELNDWFESTWRSKVSEALVVGRLYRDAYVFVDVKDNKDPSTPLAGHRGILRIEVFAEHEITFDNGDYDYSEFGTPSTSRGALIFPNRIHCSRIIRVPGKIMPAVIREYSYGRGTHNYANSSVLDAFYGAFLGWIQSNGSAIQMIDSHSAFIMKMKNLALKVKGQNSDELSGRFKMILQGLKKVKGIFVDANQEEATFINRTYSGVDDILDCIESYMSSASDTPREFLVEPRSKVDGISLAAREELAQSIDLYKDSHIKPILSKILKIWDLCSTKTETIGVPIIPVFGESLILTPTEKAAQRFKTIQGIALLGKSNFLSIAEARWTLAKDERLVECQLNIDDKQTSKLEKQQRDANQPKGRQTSPETKMVNTLTSKEGKTPYASD
jgi:Protein of unknown function (DUF1073)